MQCFSFPSFFLSYILSFFLVCIFSQRSLDRFSWILRDGRQWNYLGSFFCSKFLSSRPLSIPVLYSAFSSRKNGYIAVFLPRTYGYIVLFPQQITPTENVLYGRLFRCCTFRSCSWRTTRGNNLQFLRW